MYKIKVLFLLLFIYGSSNKIFAQSRSDAKDNKTVIIFNNSSTNSSDSKKKKGSSENNVIKIAPLGLLSGTFPLLYERRITDFFSLQAGIGLTQRNYIRNAFAGDDFSNITFTYTNGITSDYSESIYSFNSRKIKMGYLFTLQPRLYFASEGLDGSFLGLSLDNYKYNFEIPAITGNLNNYLQNGAMKSEYEKITDYMVHFGYQNLNDKISFEMSTGIGIRNVKGVKYAATFNNSGALVEGDCNYSQNILNYSIGIKVGIHF